MGKVNLRRGLTRLYLVLWVVWIPIMLWLTHTSHIESQRMWWRWAIEAESRGDQDFAASTRTWAEHLDNQWQQERLIMLPHYGLVLPAFLYGLLYGNIMTLRRVLLWVVRGFKPDVPDRPVCGP